MHLLEKNNFRGSRWTFLKYSSLLSHLNITWIVVYKCYTSLKKNLNNLCIFSVVLRFGEVSPAAGRPLCSRASIWIVSQARLQLALFLLVLVICCYPALQRIMHLRHRHLAPNSFIASHKFCMIHIRSSFSPSRSDTPSIFAPPRSLSPGRLRRLLSHAARVWCIETQVKRSLSNLEDVVTEPRGFHRFFAGSAQFNTSPATPGF